MIKTLQITVATAGTPVPVSADTDVRSGTQVCVKAKKTNTGSILVGRNSADALAVNNTYFGLAANEAIEVRVDNLNQIYLDTTVNGEGVQVIFEPNI